MPLRGTPVILGTFQLGSELKLSQDGKGTSAVQLAKTGKNFKKGSRTFDITIADIDSMVENAKKCPTAIPFDYNHLSLAAAVPDQAIAAGWLKNQTVERRGNEMWGEAEWTSKAVQHIQNKEYRYISPVIMHNSVDEYGNEIGTELLSVAITNYPFLKGMAAVSLSSLTDSGVVLTDLSIDERRARVSTAITEKFGAGWDYVYMVDCFDDYAVYRKDSKSYRINYSVDDSLNVTLEGEPQEVVTQYTVLSSQQPGGSSMGAEATKNDNPIDLSKLDLSKVDLSTHPAFVALSKQLETMNGALTAAQAEAKTNADRAVALETKLKEQAAEAAVAPLIAAGKIKADDKADWVALHVENPERFTKLAASLRPAVKLNTQHGAGTVGDDEEQVIDDINTSSDAEAAIRNFENKVNAYALENKVKHGEAIRAVSLQDPKAAELYRNGYAKLTATAH